MRKILLSVLLMSLGGWLSAQSLQLKTLDGKLIANDATLYWGGLPTEYMVARILVSNTSTEAKNVFVKKYEEFAAKDSTATFCWGACFPWFVNVSPEGIVIDAGGTSTDFTADYDAGGVLGHTRLKFTFFVENNPNDSVSFRVEFSPSYLSLRNTEDSIPTASVLNVVGSYTEVIQYDLILTNHSKETKNVSMHKIHLSVIEGTEMYFCWGDCYPPDVFELPEPMVMAAGESSQGLSVDYDPKSHSGTSTITYVFYDFDHPADSVWVDFAFDGQAAGIDYLASDILKISYRAFSHELFIEWENEISYGSKNLQVIDMSGKVVFTKTLSSNSRQQTITLPYLSQGIYMIVINLPDGMVYRNKFLISR
ncbi:MAG TPA: T9SS type A sorting domain-containing protein [Bacteroidales bacterium]|jgi:hypothetical protein|nr:T9SS type A sorting domain-containing protein [Bacteroidales bacterium]MDI9573552.1 T9SS type A sorting domain-containing protein [Bacteroidota bacterium]OQC61915.1 MAG: hypothetical protein BWX51_00056 [Bacteroidetes bacterium ADurb.Bin012]MBP9511186.1 T9SS type A sorting domain-containing protein [Bacteroidales bacterium]MBP9587602.1 T9SS type A sorting domain-containing protein [Bacteroidales bacterium]